MAASEEAPIRWGETAVTEIVISRAAEAVTVVPFTQRAEALSGADWIWWWLDGTAAYGMLIQAKRVTISARGRWSFDFNYKTQGATLNQRQTLMNASAQLGLMPAYATYLGTADYRSWHRCPDGHHSGRCLQCVKRSVSIMPALLADPHVVTDAKSTYQRSVALEEIGRSTGSKPSLIPVLGHQLGQDVREFLSSEQAGVMAVTRSMIDRVLAVRAGQFSAVETRPILSSSAGAHDKLGTIFQDLPDDTGHWGTPYLKQTLYPLRRAPPDYVLDAKLGDLNIADLTAEMPVNVAGMVIARPPEAPD